MVRSAPNLPDKLLRRQELADYGGRRLDLSRAKRQLPVVSRTPGVKLLSEKRDVQGFAYSILRAFSQDGSIFPVFSEGDLVDFAENGGRKRVVGGRRLDAKGACTIHIGWYHWE